MRPQGVSLPLWPCCFVSLRVDTGLKCRDNNPKNVNKKTLRVLPQMEALRVSKSQLRLSDHFLPIAVIFSVIHLEFPEWPKTRNFAADYGNSTK